MRRDELLDFNLEITSLEIRTDSKIGSHKKEEVMFHNADGDLVGGFYFSFGTKVKYFIGYCSSDKIDFPSTLPSTTEKLWRITLKRTSSVQIIIHCNGQEVLDVQASDTTCRRGYWNSNWSKGPVKKIKSASSLSMAADYYRAYTGECLDLIEKSIEG